MAGLQEYAIPFRSSAGLIVGHVTITPTRISDSQTAPLVAVEATDAQEHGETIVQLQEAERYEYEVTTIEGSDLRLRCTLSSRRKSLKTGAPDAGLIETRSFCGTLLMDLVEGEVNDTKLAVASAIIDVRSIKLDYRTEYRGMLRRISDELAGLIADARSSAKLGYRSTFEDRTDPGWLQIQLELLREILDSTEFGAALHRIVSFPHERLKTATISVDTDRPIRWTPSATRQLVTRNPRRELPSDHALSLSSGLKTIAVRVVLPRRSRDLDTPENRFVKFALVQFEGFLSHAADIFDSTMGWGASKALATRLAQAVEDWLDRGVFREVGEMTLSPLGSPVLQRKAGYRDLLRWWLRFRSAAELSWKGGEDLFRAGQRDVATLYEYWLFFELLRWFTHKCRGGAKPGIEELIDGLDEGSPNLRLRKQIEIGPFVGAFAGQGRRLNARFSYNRLFKVTSDHELTGSWTRRLQPDYTLTFWPEEFSESEADQNELLVHVHFDAKYRIENIESLFGGEDEIGADYESDNNYKRQDLLKMHAYRDAIKRSQGAYVLYPGRSHRVAIFKGFHEILPGLGAFGIYPDANGAALGIEAFGEFLDDVLSHLSNRTTARDRANYHLAEAYRLRNDAVSYGDIRLPETDGDGSRFRSLPPDECMVLVAPIENDAQIQLATSEDGVFFVQISQKNGRPHIRPIFARLRHIALITEDARISSIFLSLRTPGFWILTGSELSQLLKRDFGAQGAQASTVVRDQYGAGAVYALFQTHRDINYGKVIPDGRSHRDIVEIGDADIRNELIISRNQSSPDLKIISLSNLLGIRVLP